jgi:uncharacterized protein YqcC (DUF446 family)
LQNAQEIRDLLLRMESEMRHLDLWCATPPEPRAFASNQPFCIDTMAFETWLQWVFIPRVHALLDQGGEMPFRSQIAPLAQMMFAEMKEIRTDELEALITRFDELTGGDGETGG